MARVKRIPGNISMDELKVRIKDLGNVEGRVGWFESSKYPDGTPVAYVAAINEFGTKDIPARPMMRPTVKANRAAWMKIIADGSKAVLKGRISMVQVLEAVGLQAVGDVKKTISGITSPPLKESTIKNRQYRAKRGKSRGTSKPLIDTGYMFDTITNTVEKKK